MPRRRPEPPPTDRVPVILGIPPAASTDEGSLPAGWVPQRESLTRPESLAAVAVAAVADVAAEPGQVGVVAPTRSGFAEDPWPVPSTSVGEVAPTSSQSRTDAAPTPARPAILTVPVSLRGVRASPRRLAVLGVLVLLLVVTAVLGVRVAWARSSAKPAAVAASAHGPPSGLVSRSVPAAFASQEATGSPTAASVVLVHVVGQVRRPGVVRLAAGSRVLDAVDAAGGAKSSADLNHLNLARVVADGEQIAVPKPGEAVPAAGAAGIPGAGTGAAGGPAGADGGPVVLVDLNTADAAALDTLPGVGPVLSQRILDWRTQHGRFSSVDELGEVSGIGDKLLAQIGPKVRV